MSNKFFLLIGQFLISIMFLLVAFSTIINYQSSFVDLEGVVHQFFAKQDFTSNVSMSTNYSIHVIMVLNIALQLIGGVLVFFNLSPKLGALLLMIYVAYSTLLYHPFWMVDASETGVQLILFLKNITIFAGLWILLFASSGPLRRRSKKKNVGR